MLYSIIWL